MPPNEVSVKRNFVGGTKDFLSPETLSCYKVEEGSLRERSPSEASSLPYSCALGVLKWPHKSWVVAFCPSSPISWGRNTSSLFLVLSVLLVRLWSIKFTCFTIKWLCVIWFSKDSLNTLQMLSFANICIISHPQFQRPFFLSGLLSIWANALVKHFDHCSGHAFGQLPL